MRPRLTQKPVRHRLPHHFRRTPSDFFDEMAGALQAGTASKTKARHTLFTGAIRCSEWAWFRTGHMRRDHHLRRLCLTWASCSRSASAISNSASR